MPKLHDSRTQRLFMLFLLGFALYGIKAETSPLWLNIAIIIGVGLSLSLQVQLTEGRLEKALLQSEKDGLTKKVKAVSGLEPQTPSKLFRVLTPKLVIIILAESEESAREDADVFLKFREETRKKINRLDGSNLLETDEEYIVEVKNIPKDQKVSIIYEFVEFELYPQQWEILVRRFNLPPVLYLGRAYKGTGKSVKEILAKKGIDA